MACAGKLVILNGSPHSGHDLIAAELAWLAPEVYYAIGADMLHRKVLPGPTEAPILEIILSASARNGSSIAADYCLTRPGQVDTLKSLAQGLDLTWVDVRCEPQLRAMREQERGPRAAGPASLECLPGPPDLTLDGADPRAAAQQLQDFLQERPMIREPLARFAPPLQAQGKGTVVMLCGTSSAGKSTLQRALQRRRPFLGYGLDAAYQAIPLRYMGLPINAQEIAEGFDRKDGWMGATNVPMPAESLPDGPRMWQQVGPVLRQSASSMYASIAALARSGNDVVSDQVLYYRDWYEEAQHRLAGVNVVWVSVEADPEALQQHEQQRGDRVQGVSLGLLDQMFKDVPFAARVHSGRSTPEEEAERVLQEIPPP